MDESQLQIDANNNDTDTCMLTGKSPETLWPILWMHCARNSVPPYRHSVDIDTRERSAIKIYNYVSA